MTEELKVLVVDGEDPSRQDIADALRSEGCSVVEAADPAHALDVLCRERPAIVLVDVRLPGMPAVDFARAVTTLRPLARVAFVAGGSSADERLAADAIRAGAHELVRKPVTQFALRELLGRARDMRAVATSAARTGEALREQLALRLELASASAEIAPAVARIVRIVGELLDERETKRLELALHEILRNAFEHGNLGVTFDEKVQHCENGSFEALLEERGLVARERGRMIRVEATMASGCFRCTVQDDGAGFDWRRSHDRTATVDQLTGRGLFLVRSYFDSVEFNERGNVVTVTKRLRDPA